jgi:FkbM family methyltransferase
MIRTFRRYIDRVLARAYAASGHALVPSDLPWVQPFFVHRTILARRTSLVLDIGANEGQFVHMLRKVGYVGGAVSFEPQPHPFAVLSRACAADPAWECHNLGIGDTPGQLEMHVSGFSPSSSFLPIGKQHLELMPNTAEVGAITADVVRLDDWLSAHGKSPGGPVFLKIDVQGFETSVIRGGPRTVAAADGALVELNFADLFDGQSKYYEVMALLQEAGLQFFGLFDPNLDPVSRAVLWADGLFLRPRGAAAAGVSIA